MDDSLRGRVLDGRYRLDAPIGEGGLGVVYRGTQLRLQRPIAVKILHRQHTANPALRARFEREARSLAALNHPNIVAILDCGLEEDLPYLVMEMIEGRSLERAIEQGVPLHEALRIVIQIAFALAYAHERGIIHRDLKPGNVLLQSGAAGVETARVLDFGLAKFVESGESDLTRLGTIMGTPAYIPPEQAAGERVGPAADIYALGIVLFELVAGELPYEGDTVEVLRHHLLSPLPSVTRRRGEFAGSQAIDAFLSRACAKAPGARFASGAELHAALVALETELGFGPRETPLASSIARSSPAVTATSPTLPIVALEHRAVPSPAASPPQALVFALGGLALVLAVLGLGRACVVDEAPQPPPELGRTEGQRQPSPPPPPSAPDAVQVEPPPDMEFTLEESTPAELALPDEEVEARVAEAEAAVDPWAAGVPRELAAYRERTRRRAMTPRERRAIEAWIAEHPEDCRGPLAYGHALFVAGASSAALESYRAALEADLDARNDGTLQQNLLTMAMTEALHEPAASLLRDVYADTLATLIAGRLASHPEPRSEALLRAVLP